PDPRVHEDGGLQPEDVAPEVDDVPPPEVPDVPLHLHPEGAVVPGRAEPAVDLARLEDESPPLAEGDERVHVDHGSSLPHGRQPALGDQGRSQRWRSLKPWSVARPRRPITMIPTKIRSVKRPRIEFRIM